MNSKSFENTEWNLHTANIELDVLPIPSSITVKNSSFFVGIQTPTNTYKIKLFSMKIRTWHFLKQRNCIQSHCLGIYKNKIWLGMLLMERIHFELEISIIILQRNIMVALFVWFFSSFMLYKRFGRTFQLIMLFIFWDILSKELLTSECHRKEEKECRNTEFVITSENCLECYEKR